jgi:hypothetical protein
VQLIALVNAVGQDWILGLPEVDPRDASTEEGDLMELDILRTESPHRAHHGVTCGGYSTDAHRVVFLIHPNHRFRRMLNTYLHRGPRPKARRSINLINILLA